MIRARPSPRLRRVTARSAVGASVDLGSNSVHLLVAAIAGHELGRSSMSRSSSGSAPRSTSAAHLGVARRAELVEALVRYAATARQARAADITFMGTEPIRRAADAATIVADVERATGVPLHVLSHEEEAYLTLIGVTSGCRSTHETLVVDIGGGSSEFCAVAAGGVARAAGLQLGSNRLSAGLASDDPPTAEPARRDGRRRRRDPPRRPPGRADRPRPGGRDRIQPAQGDRRGDRASAVLTASGSPRRWPHSAAMPAAETAERFAVNPTRARLLPAGAVIVDALMRHYGVERRAGVRGRDARGGDPRGRARRSGVARPPARRSRTAGARWTDRQRPATTRPRVRRKLQSGNAPPRSARSCAAGARPPSRGRPGSGRSPRSRDVLRSPACSTRKVRVIDAVTLASFISPR